MNITYDISNIEYVKYEIVNYNYYYNYELHI